MIPAFDIFTLLIPRIENIERPSCVLVQHDFTYFAQSRDWSVGVESAYRVHERHKLPQLSQSSEEKASPRPALADAMCRDFILPDLQNISYHHVPITVHA